MKAIGSYIFAGGFTIGVKKHFDVKAHFEGDGEYGGDTFSLNYPDIPIYSGPEDWPIEEWKDNVDFIYGNPPCAPWSTLGSSSKGADGWKDDPRISCWNDVFSLLYSVRPRALAIESVPRVYSVTGGRPMIEDFTRKAKKEGYGVTHLLVDGQYAGLPHSRKRFFFLAHKGNFNPPAPNWSPASSVGEILDELKADGVEPGHTGKLNENEMNLVKIAKPGESLRNIWERLNPPETWIRSPTGRKGVKGRPQFMKWRLRREQIMGVIAGGFAIHPEEDRLLGIKELAYFSGFPVDYKFAGPASGWPSLLARGVMPPVGEWLARNVKAMLESNAGFEINDKIIDYRKPLLQEDLFNA